MELSIDTASEIASVALSREGTLQAEVSWRCRRNHTVELLATIDRLLGQMGAAKEDLAAVFVCVGPGMYTVHRAGRGELAWAAYRSRPWRQITAPRLDWPADVVRRARGRTLFCGEVDDELAKAIGDALANRAVIASPAASVRRAAFLAELGHQRLAAGEGGDAAALRVVYLRPPAISPQKPARRLPASGGVGRR
jgi:tRNA A37 threonylcarbamoyladenosine modification protein TsaB